jgi:tetratricopeptide (TPR) repeat protein
MKNLVVLTVFVLGGVFFSCWAFADGSLGNVVELSEASHDSYNSGTDAAADTGSADTTDKDTTESTEPPATTTEKTTPPATTETTPPKTTEKTTPETTTPKTTESPKTTPEKTTAAGVPAQFTSDHYRVYSDESQEKAELIAQKAEACLTLYNSIFHFDLTKLSVKLKVKIFGTKAAFDDYIKKFVSEKKNDFVYIHYSDLGKCELVGFEKNNESEFNQALLHQGFVQFIKAYITNPPLWLQEGMAAYFEQAEYKPDLKTFVIAGELVWLETLKRIIKNEDSSAFLPFDQFLNMDKTMALAKISTFYPEAWGLIYFLLKSPNRDINRILWDSLSVLSPADSVLDNSKRVEEKAFGWLGTAKIEEEYKDFILSMKTFPDLVTEGVNYYSNNELDKAKKSFSDALERDTTNYIPYYYLGLINYSQKDYLTAETYYNKALELGAPSALIAYALGVNAFADNNYEVAVSHLKEAEKLDPDNYKEKVDELLQRIENASTL